MQRGDTFILLVGVDDISTFCEDCSTAQESRLMEVRMMKGGGSDSCWCNLIFLLGDAAGCCMTVSISEKVRLGVSSAGRSKHPKSPTSRGVQTGV